LGVPVEINYSLMLVITDPFPYISVKLGSIKEMLQTYENRYISVYQSNNKLEA